MSSRAGRRLGAVGVLGRLAGRLHCLHALVQAAVGEDHVAGVGEPRPLLLVLLAVPDAIAKVDGESCRGAGKLKTGALPACPLGDPHSPISSQMEKRSHVR